MHSFVSIITSSFGYLTVLCAVTVAVVGVVVIVVVVVVADAAVDVGVGVLLVWLMLLVNTEVCYFVRLVRLISANILS